MTDKHKQVSAWILMITGALWFCTSCENKQIPETDNQTITAVTHPTIPSVLQATVTIEKLNVHSQIGNDTPVHSILQKGDTVTILEQEELNGILWGRTEAGWICLIYTSIEEIPVTQIQETTSSPQNYLYEARIIVDELNIRSGPGADNEKIGKFHWDDTVQILEEQGMWGRTEYGWISLNYIYAEGHPSNVNLHVQVLARALHLRYGPGTAYDSIQELKQGEHVTILKQGTFGHRSWGYTGTGWVCMDYVEPINK